MKHSETAKLDAQKKLAEYEEMMTQKDEGHGEAINKLKEHEEALALKDQDHAET